MENFQHQQEVAISLLDGILWFKIREQQAQEQYVQETTFEKKPSLWQRIKNSKIVRAIRYAMKIRVVLQYPALPEGKGENY